MQRDRGSLYDILESVRLIRRYVAGMDRAKFGQDVAIQDAVVRRFEIMGEATKRLSESTRKKHPHIPWREMAQMRDRVIHGYDTVDLNVMWKTIHEDLPELEPQLANILEQITPNE